MYIKKKGKVYNLSWDKMFYPNGTPIIIKEKEIIASCYVRNNFIYSLVVNPKYRRMGYGSKLLKLAEEQIKKNYKCSKVVPQDNDLKLRDYYSKNGYLGFSKSETDYIDEDKYWWIMWKKLK